MEREDKESIAVTMSKQFYGSYDRTINILEYLEKLDNKEITLVQIPEEYREILKIISKRENETAISHIYRILTSDNKEAIELTNILEDFETHVF